MSAGPTTRAISEYLLALHEQANERTYRAFQEFALQRWKTLVPFDAGLFAIGTLRNGVPHGHDVMLHNRTPEFMESWDTVKDEDRLAVAVMTNPGKTVNVSLDSPLWEGTKRIIGHCRAWGIEHAMCTAMIHKVAGLYWVVSMYRHDIDKPFTEEERAATEVVVPHVFAAARQARLGELRASTRVSETHGQSSAIVSEEGIVFEFEPTLVDLLRQQWPNWTGPWLPADLWSELRETPRARVTIGTLVVRSDAFDGGRLIHVRRAVAADRLTVREREIAEGFSLGETYKELGERFGISPNTVRRHLANIYEKLGIASKAELDRMLSGLG